MGCPKVVPLPSHLYIHGEGVPRRHTTTYVSRVRRPPPQITPSVIFSWCLGEALRESLHHHCHHAVVLTELSLDTLLDQEFKGHHRAERVQNSEVSYVWCLIGWITKMFDYINRIKLTLPLLVYGGTWTHSPPLVAMHLLDRSCVSVGIFLKLHATFPNSGIRARSMRR